MEECAVSKDSNGTALPWFLPVNGHLYSESELTANGNLAYKPNRSYLINSTKQECKSRGREVHLEMDTFHVGPDSLLHFTETHNGMVKPVDEFCVDLFYDGDQNVDLFEGTGENEVYD